MRTRLLAFCILAIFIGIPAVAYWYFFSSNITTLELILSPPDADVSIVLEGRIEYKYLPLADKAFLFRQSCPTECVLQLPPLRYDMVLTASGHESIAESITLPLGTTTRIERNLPKKLESIKKLYSNIDPSLISALIQNANVQLGGVYRGIGTTRGGRYLALRSTGSIYEVGILSPESFISIFPLSYPPKNIMLDISRTTLVIDQGDSVQYISSIDGISSTVFPRSEKILIADIARNSVLTESGSYIRSGERWVKNPRFTDTLLLPNGNLIGYIDKRETEKLVLQNYPPGKSIFVEIDTRSGQVKTRKIGLDILGFTLIDGVPGYIDVSGDFFILEL